MVVGEIMLLVAEITGTIKLFRWARNELKAAVRSCRSEEATQQTDKAVKFKVTTLNVTYVQNNTYVQNSKNLIGHSAARPARPARPSNLTLEGNHGVPEKRKDGKPRKSKEFEKQEKEYKTWLKKNITKWTDSWTRYKTDSERATNSKLDLAEKERLFRKHVDELREQYLRDYRQLLKEVITPDLASKYLTSWSDAKSRMLQRQRFLKLPERERETEWRSHAEQILKKRRKTK